MGREIEMVGRCKSDISEPGRGKDLHGNNRNTAQVYGNGLGKWIREMDCSFI